MTKAYPQCESCYIKDNSVWEPESVGDDGSLISKLIAVTVPLDISTGQINVCAMCGEITVIGIFAEMEEDDVQYEVDPLNVDELNLWTDEDEES
jgi:hypothetical protein